MVKILIAILFFRLTCISSYAQNLGDYSISFRNEGAILTSNMATNNNDDLIIASCFSDSGLVVCKLNKCRLIEWTLKCSSASNIRNVKTTSSRYANSLLVKSNNEVCYVAVCENLKPSTRLDDVLILSIYCIDIKKGNLIWSKTMDRTLKNKLVNFEIFIKEDNSIICIVHHKIEYTPNEYHYSLQLIEYDYKTGKELNSRSYKSLNSNGTIESYNLNFLIYDGFNIQLIRNYGINTFLTKFDLNDLKVKANSKINEKFNFGGSTLRHSTVILNKENLVMGIYNLEEYGPSLVNTNYNLDTFYVRRFKNIPVNAAFQSYSNDVLVFKEENGSILVGKLKNEQDFIQVALNDLDFSLNQGIIGLLKNRNYIYMYSNVSSNSIGIIDFDFNSNFECLKFSTGKTGAVGLDTIVIKKQSENLIDGNYLIFNDTIFQAVKVTAEITKNCNDKNGLFVGFVANDTIVCQSNFTINAQNVPLGAKVKWSTGDSSQSITVGSSGYYYITVSNGYCQVTDSIHVQFIKNPIYKNRKSFFKCIDNKAVVKLNNYEFYNLIYPNGDTVFGTKGIESLDLGDTGRYKFFVKEKYACNKSYNFSVNNSVPQLNLANDTILCNKLDLSIGHSPLFTSFFYTNYSLTDSFKIRYYLSSKSDSIAIINAFDSIKCSVWDTMRISEYDMLKASYAFDWMVVERFHQPNVD